VENINVPKTMTNASYFLWFISLFQEACTYLLSHSLIIWHFAVFSAYGGYGCLVHDIFHIQLLFASEIERSLLSFFGLPVDH